MASLQSTREALLSIYETEASSTVQAVAGPLHTHEPPPTKLPPSALYPESWAVPTALRYGSTKGGDESATTSKDPIVNV
jgi:hypothetical protein